MPSSQTRETPEIEASLALRRAKSLSMLSEAIPLWPEKIAGLLFLFFSVALFAISPGHEFAKILMVGSLGCIFGIQWFVIRRLRQKLEALAEAVANK